MRACFVLIALGLTLVLFNGLGRIIALPTASEEQFNSGEITTYQISSIRLPAPSPAMAKAQLNPAPKQQTAKPEKETPAPLPTELNIVEKPQPKLSKDSLESEPALQLEPKLPPEPKQNKAIEQKAEVATAIEEQAIISEPFSLETVATLEDDSPKPIDKPEPVESNSQQELEVSDTPSPSLAKLTTSKEASPIYRIEPIYPKRAIKQRKQGFVQLQFQVNQKGYPQEIEVIQSQPKGLFERNAIQALKQWRYPEGSNLEQLHLVTIEFRLR